MRKNYIFIISQFRTGSTLLLNILDNNSQIKMLPDEIHLINSYPWVKDLSKFLTKRYSSFDEKKMFIDYLFSMDLDGAFWKKIECYNIKKGKLYENVPNMECIGIDLINTIFNGYFSKFKETRYVGAKNPVYIWYLNKVDELYPICKKIFLVRDPRAIYISKKNDEYGKILKQKSKSLKKIYNFFTLVRLIFEYNSFKTIFKRYHDSDKCYLIRYEDILLTPENEINKLCNFLDINFEKDMLYSKGKKSSYDEFKSTENIDKARAYFWKKKITHIENFLISSFTSNSIEYFGYDY